jgi:pimeloyl-ACP methyl ester carboxylesterase
MTVENRATIPFDDFEGQGTLLLHFAHANGFTPGAYGQLLSGLSNTFRVLAMRQRPLWPGSRPQDAGSAQLLVDDLVRFLDQEQLEGVIGAGHSMGAVLTMLAARQRPQLFRALVLIEPVFLLPALVQALNADPPLIPWDEIPVVKAALNRRQRWAEFDEAFAHFRSKPVFAGWSDDALWDYVRHGLQHGRSGNVEMVYTAAWEAHVYTLMLMDVWQHLAEVKLPVLAVRAAQSDTLVPEAWALWRRLQPDATFVEVPATTHLLTMEEPELLAGLIRRFVAELPAKWSRRAFGEQL